MALTKQEWLALEKKAEELAAMEEPEEKEWNGR